MDVLTPVDAARAEIEALRRPIEQLTTQGLIDLSRTERLEHMAEGQDDLAV